MDVDAAAWDRFLLSMTRIQHLKYISVGVLTYLIVDYFDTLADEVKYIWKSRWNSVKILFFVTRYLPFIDVPLSVTYNEALGLSADTCQGIFSANTFLCIMSTGIAEAIMFLRVYALSKHSRVVGVYLMIHFSLVQIASLVLWSVFAASLDFYPQDPSFPMPCIPLKAEMDHLSAIFALVFANQLAITALSLYFILNNFNLSTGPLFNLLWQDGVFYFFVMSGITIANFVLSRAMPPEYQFLLTSTQRILYATFSSRIVLRMRKYAGRALDETYPTLSEVRFDVPDSNTTNYTTNTTYELSRSKVFRSHAKTASSEATTKIGSGSEAGSSRPGSRGVHTPINGGDVT